MEEHPRRTFDEIPSEVVTILAENMITTNLKNSFGKVASKAALNQFLFSLQKNNLVKN